MNRPIVTLPYQSGEPAASSTPAEPDSGIATPAATSVGTSTSHAAMLDVAATLGTGGTQTTANLANPANVANPAVAGSAPAAASAATATGATTAAGAGAAAGQLAGDPAGTGPMAAAQAATRVGPTIPVATGVDTAAARNGEGTAPGGLKIGPAQIICWQLAVVVVAVAVGARIGQVGTIAAVAGALALIAVTAVRVRGTWLHQWIGIGLRYVLRRRRTELPQDGGAATALLELWLGPTGIDVAHLRERPIGLVSHRGALGTMLQLDTSSPIAIREALAGLSKDEGTPLAASVDEQPVDLEAQLVVHGGLHHDREPHGWLAVAAQRNAGMSTDEQLAKVLKNAIRRMQRHLDRVGASTVPVDDSAAAGTIVALAHTDAGRGHLRERWSVLSAGPVSQACLRLAGFQRLTPTEAEALVRALLSTSTGTAVTFSVGARLRREGASIRRHDPVLRIAAASPGDLDLAVTVLGRVAGSYRLRPERLDGRHGPATAASLPIGRNLV